MSVPSSDLMLTSILTTLRERYVHDLNKPKVDHFERAAIIRQVLDDSGLSIRQMSKKFNIPKSTVEDWLLFERISEIEYAELLKAGWTHTQIYYQLRATKTSDSNTLIELDAYLTEVAKKLRGIAQKPQFNYSNKTSTNCDAVEKSIKLLLSKINELERNNKNVNGKNGTA